MITFVDSNRRENSKTQRKLLDETRGKLESVSSNPLMSVI